ncbi:hypothetical protein Dshi_2030 [Dinoroseobacter shibae DFL 12 = DSM 16493]|uniref:Uncharacterized protein n=1 Tax=Dinoroseobacter shibae (strain DSM 16493 / NCIMB 14021 / DFL 12) TaxID=398580 RepID=A8LPR5_DINSH|nr:hypothetical protein [Dinoroseobacter shibae]ABV93769.1 hypothetical protein Dshi_2030 [Dinoroseobacter shibae DFL 12 = DSM 16493]URF45221.1 hypothetical protein M8008_10505 [Dinoroseobacter shibae]URF49526.1 hypothetical protein M8007_10505 [Dinoroseobacter shibae]
MFLALSAAVFTIYVANVVMGAVTNAPMFSDVTEMVILFIAAILFTVAILKAEAADPDRKDRNP